MTRIHYGSFIYSLTEPDFAKKTINLTKSVITAIAHPAIIIISTIVVIMLATPFNAISGIREKSKGNNLKRQAVTDNVSPAVIIDIIFRR